MEFRNSSRLLKQVILTSCIAISLLSSQSVFSDDDATNPSQSPSPTPDRCSPYPMCEYWDNKEDQSIEVYRLQIRHEQTTQENLLQAKEKTAVDDSKEKSTK